MRFTLTLWAIGLLPMIAVGAELPVAEVEFFEKKIRPALVQYCYACHSEAAQKQGKLRGELLLDSRAGWQRGGSGGPVVTPGKAATSRLIQSLRHQNDMAMPPSRRLDDALIADFVTWIERGAIDPRGGSPLVVPTGPLWSLQPIRLTVPPTVRDTSWSRQPLDQYLLASLEKRGLRPTQDATPAQLLRRLHANLTGLPPTLEELDAFLDDHSPQALERVVDRLLASPHFGERWGRHWLDLARYSESCGQSRNMIWHHAWRYRDYVIAAFNDDMPYPQFVREQIAGDLLPAPTPADADRQRIATAFLALGPKTFDEPKREQFRMDLIDEQIDVVSRTFLGISVSCARCHDHKYDPVPTRDYYAWAGIFRSTDTLHGLGPKGIRGLHDAELQPIGPHADRAAAAWKHTLRVAELTQLRNDGRSSRYRFVRQIADRKLALMKPDANKGMIEADIAKFEAEVRVWEDKIKAFDAELEATIDAPPQPEWTFAVRDAVKMDDSRIHLQGEIGRLGEPVPRGMLGLFPTLAKETIPAQQSGRLQLAEWIVCDDNPLSSRVMVNRVWLHLFGQGLVASPDDFGVNGAKPTHPELLDALAAEFQRHGSIKKLIRTIVLSRAYQLDSQAEAALKNADADNQWYARARVRRLEVEAFRDAILSISGQLDTTPMPQSTIARLHPFREDELFSFKPFLKVAGLEHSRRSVYLPIVRGVLPEMFSLFDFAAPTRTNGRRDETLVPAQGLFLLNSPWIIEQAQHAAQRLLAEPLLTDAQRVERMYRLSYQRMPMDGERESALAYLHRGTESERLERWSTWCQAIFASGEFRYIE